MDTKQTNQLTVLDQAQSNLREMIEEKRDAMPKDFNKTRFIQNCMAVLMDTREIGKCDPVSIARTMIKGAFLDLDFFMKECYAIPYGNALNFQTDWKGEIKVIKKYSIEKIRIIYPDIVREGDQFEARVTNGEKTVNHIPDSFSDGDIKGAYAVVVYGNGSVDYELMSKKEIEDIRKDFSKAVNSKAWKSAFGEMCKKTVLRRLRKRIPITLENAEQAKALEEGGDLDVKKHAIDVSTLPVAAPLAAPALAEEQPAPKSEAQPPEDMPKIEELNNGRFAVGAIIPCMLVTVFSRAEPRNSKSPWGYKVQDPTGELIVSVFHDGTHEKGEKVFIINIKVGEYNGKAQYTAESMQGAG